MPKKNIVPFIDKKKAVTFQLVHRSQQDPLVADESAPQRVLVPIVKHENKKSSTETQNDASQNYNVSFDKDYEYLQHITDTSTLDSQWESAEKKVDNSSVPTEECNLYKITLPSSVFESCVEEKIGLLNKAAPVSKLQLHLNADLVAAMDDDFDFDDPDNELPDNFVEMANQMSVGDECDEEYFYNDRDDFEASQYPFANEETKSRFTEYSISSSVMKRNDQLSMLDDKFEKLYADYDEHVLGSLDCEEIEGTMEIDSQALLQITNEFNGEEQEVENIVKQMNNRMSLKNNQQEISDIDCHTEPRKLVTLSCNKNKWDCNSILSIYNNNENRPKFIQEPENLGTIKINTKTGIPKDSVKQSLTVKNLKQTEMKTAFAESKNFQKVSTMGKSEKETPQEPEIEKMEKKLRKQAVKNERRERRKERKINILAFKGEEKKQKQILLNKSQNIQGNRIL